MDLTQESVLGFLLERGGQVRNSELVKHFRGPICSGGPAEQRRNRELFKRLVNSVAVVRQAGEAKLVVLRKRYQDFLREESCGDARIPGAACEPPGCAGGRSADPAASVKVLSVSRDRPGKSGAVFAVIAVRSPERGSTVTAAAAEDGFISTVHQRGNSEKPVIRVSSLPVVTSTSSCWRDLTKEELSLKSKQTEGGQTLGSPPLRPNNKAPRRDDPKYSESVPLEPIAHEWLVKCAAGLWGQIYALLLQDARLAHRKDFMSGFTALHWAAKDGSCDMIHKLVDVSARTGAHVDVDSKAHGGHTPLHVAAMHGRSEVVVTLVRRYGASVHERDNGGRKALHYLGEGALSEARALLGGPPRAGEGTEGCREALKGFSAISKRFHSHTGRKHKSCGFANEC